MNLSRLELRVPPLLLTAVAALLAWAAAKLLPAAALPFPGHQALAAATAVAGAVFLFGSALQFRLRRTTLDPRTPDKATHFVARGFYALSRNPMYVGMAALLLALALWHANVAALAVVGGFCAYLTAFQIKPEERALAQRFGAAYLQYKSSVRRWL
jgi:protein-S-isoprenylcysteine O-methyltransferase Ste14